MIVLARNQQDPGALLDHRILAFMHQAGAAEVDFDSLARELFAYQYAFNEPYRRLCDQRGRTPASVAHWRDIPAVAAASFADARLATFAPDRTRLWFDSSGTTRAGGRSSRHELETTELYDASLALQFRHCVMPDRERMPLFVFAPPFDQAPHSSLSYMLSRLFERFASGGGFCVDGEDLRIDWTVESLRNAREPVVVFGTAFALLHFADRCRADGVDFRLPAGSRIVETGGFKGRSRTLAPADFYALLTDFFGVPRDWCVSEYGMCELGSQWYDANLADVLAGRRPRRDVKVGPHWARHIVVDPVSAEAVGGGEGLLQLFDLCNRGSVAAVLTADVVCAEGDGFVFKGRAAGAPPKGCSISADELLSGHAGRS